VTKVRLYSLLIFALTLSLHLSSFRPGGFNDGGFW